MHPLESAGLGKGPFRFFSMERTAGRCQCCGQPVEVEYQMTDAEGRIIVVGCRSVEGAYTDNTRTEDVPGCRLAG